MRNLDLTALRSFVAVADAGGVTRAAGFLNLTQSAVSMQLKRLEESLGEELLDRSARKIALTAQGQQLLGYGRRMLALNDEAYSRLTHAAFEGEVRLGVPSDIVHPYVPEVLKRFRAAYPRVNVRLISSYTNRLKGLFARGECDLILTTEIGGGGDCETLNTVPLVWVGAPGGQAFRARPLRLAFERACLIRPMAMRVLEAAGIPWELGVDTDSSRTVEASVMADLAIHASLEGHQSAFTEVIDTRGELPDLGEININLYTPQDGTARLASELGVYVRQAFCA